MKTLYGAGVNNGYIMAVVRPVYFNNGNIQQMDDTMFGLLKDVFRYQFQQTSPITQTVVNSGGNLTDCLCRYTFAGVPL